MSDLYTRFACPTAEYRGKPFWAWNGELERSELLRQIGVMREMGFGGFFMHSRTGLATEYLGDEWFELINACADEAERLGLEAWLYDEDRWPSGSAGGLVTRDPRYRMKYLRLSQVPGSDFIWHGDIVAAFVCRLDGIGCYDCQRIRHETPAASLHGRDVLVFTVEEMATSSFYNGATYLDTLNPAATARFIELTHERYKARCGDRLGRSIKGVFTDEPHRGLVMCSTGHVNPDPEWLVPWTDRLLETFRERFGYDLADHLPAVFLRPDGQRLSAVKWHYMEHLQTLFLEGFARPCAEWCRANGLLLTGHVLHEDTLGAQAVPCGSVMRYYEHMDCPGVDLLAEGNRSYWVVKQVASVARQLGRTWVLSELYGCTGWQMSFAAHKAVGDWQSLLGVSLRCPHLSWYTMAGEAKRDFPGSILHQSAWYPEYRCVEDYFSRMHVILTEGKPVCDVLVIHPIESVWAQVHVGWAAWLDSTDAHVKRLDEVFQAVFRWLSGAQIDFDYADEDHLARLGAVGTDNGRPTLRVGQSAYRCVLVAGLETVRSSTLDLVERFAQAGGTVIFAGNPPTHADALPSCRPRELCESCTRVELARESLVDAVRAAVRPAVMMRAADTGAPLESVFCHVRETDLGTFVVAVNTDRDNAVPCARVWLAGHGCVEEWKCATGERFSLPATEHDGGVEFTTSFPPMGEHVWLLLKERHSLAPPAPAWREVGRCELHGPFGFTLDEGNVCVLDRARFRLDGGDWEPECEILQVDRAVRRRLGLDLRGGEMLQPWYTRGQCHEVKAYLELEFSFDVSDTPGAPLVLVLENPHAFEVAVNGARLDTASAQGWWVDVAFSRLLLPGELLKLGANTVSLATAFRDTTNIEALYLVGSFGVAIEGTRRILVRSPRELAIGDLVGQGLPFYTGRVAYALEPVRMPSGAAQAVLSLGRFEGACAVVSSTAAGPRVMAWPPYEADITPEAQAGVPLSLEVVLTRRNVFGPLHQVPLRAPAYGPDSFTTTGDAFCEGYMLCPSGLLDPPVVVFRAARDQL